MKKLFVSDYVGFDESATKAAMYSFDSEEECKEFLELSHDERCQVFNVFKVSLSFSGKINASMIVNSLLQILGENASGDVEITCQLCS